MDFFFILLLSLFSIYAFVKALLLISPTRSKPFSGKLPPGPPPLPIIGNLLELGQRPHKSLAALSHTHGPIMSLKLGQLTSIVISSATMAKEVLQKHDLPLSGRSVPDALRANNHYKFSMVFLPVCSPWRNLRKISNSHIFTTQKLDLRQDFRRRKVQELLAEVRECCCGGRPVDIGKAAFKTSLNLLSNTIFSIDLADSSSDRAKEFKDIVWSIVEEAGKPNLADYFPVFGKMDLQGIRGRMTINFDKMFTLFGSIIDGRLQVRKLQKSTISNDILDDLISISEENSEEFDRNFIEHLLLDLFVAGTDTTSSTLEWAMAELLHNPETLSKARAELEQSIEKGKPLEESDIAKLPYLRAIVKEAFRLHPPVPFLIPRRAESDVEISGFTIPKGAQVLVNAWAIGRDPSFWDKPNSFVPERFLGSEMDVKGRDFELIPFGGGRRICPGLPLGNRMLHLMLGSLINSFDWKHEEGITAETMSMDDKFGITLQKAQPLRAVPIAL